ncbi:MAG TPA: metallophosphoesterase [Candidatus Krumholzibacteria bacterium]|nr:metallophosphoesterase [Candidatus Krumholzibacteria bacterium]
MRATRTLVAAVAALMVSCTMPQEPAPLPPGCFAFGVFGDGPYRIWEGGRFRRVVKDVNRADVTWFVHVGDIFWYPCSDEHYADQLAAMNAIRHPVVYTPGDNEWADCHEGIAGGYAPLERLERLRRTFYADPAQSLGAAPMRVESQSADPAFAEFVENARWTRGGFMCVTVHLVGSDNGLDDFPARTAADDSAVVRRASAATAWIEEAFAIARADSLHGVIIAMHAEPGFGRFGSPPGFGGFVLRLREMVESFDGQVLVVHGDAHEYRVDHPLRRGDREVPVENFTRIGTFGSPDIGWVRVVVDSVNGEIVSAEPRLISRWWLW